MSCLRPGGLELTRHALSFVPVEPESRLVDIGCGNGESLAMIREEYGCQVAAIEPDTKRRAQALANNPGWRSLWRVQKICLLRQLLLILLWQSAAFRCSCSQR